MNKTSVAFMGASFVVLLLIGAALSAKGVNAAPEPQGFVTATPGPDGRITYIVVEGDTCSSVALDHGITVQQYASVQHSATITARSPPDNNSTSSCRPRNCPVPEATPKPRLPT